jgi:hypothetical protein
MKVSLIVGKVLFISGSSVISRRECKGLFSGSELQQCRFCFQKLDCIISNKSKDFFNEISRSTIYVLMHYMLKQLKKLITR